MTKNKYKRGGGGAGRFLGRDGGGEGRKKVRGGIKGEDGK